MTGLSEARTLARDAVAGLRHELTEMRPTGPRGRQNATTALSVGLETAPRADAETTTQEQQSSNNQAWIPRMDNWLSR